ncbi:AMP-binding protein [Leadbettera azotonutricia]|uniref:Acyl-CoA synthase n=1 Tax=Leadbettera azotonutricia (strain ATCC BAA-888 / DSM 13862 / ZAS-9) TaxID=545695 RepID=F5YBY7_LEAAZ|nr:AMP-binding protein [Leadbettera azotonutricia]AEF81116.1 acyl-CoA synthase [Leadbettera azotonutricia ZAS-9]
MEYIEKTLSQVLRETAAKQPDHEFLVYADRALRFTYAEFDRRVDELALGLLAIGLKKGDHVGFWATNVPDWNTALFACARAGMVFVTVNTGYKSHELEFLMKQSDLACICIIDGWRDSDYVAMVYDLVPELKTAQRGYLKSEKFPFLKSVIYIGQQKHRGMYSLNEVLLLGKYTDIKQLHDIEATLDRNDVVNMQYTSGTTGFPKGVMLTHRNILNNGLGLGDNMRYTEKDIVCLPVPLFHCFGLVLGMMSIITHGSTAAILEWFDPLLVLATIQKEKCTAVYGVPTMFIAELNHPMFKMFDLTSLRTGIMAGSVCPIEAMRQVIDLMHMSEVTIVYGLTESSPGMTQTRYDDPIEVKVETVGRALPGVEVTIRDPETGEECANGTHGEFCCRGYNTMKGYYKLPEDTAKCIDKKGWLHSGDLGVKDEKGYFRVTGRIKDMIIRGGENVYPKEIEDFLYTMPGVKDVQVVGVASKKYGEEVGAFVILHPAITMTEEDVRDYCRGKISRFKIPKYVFFVESFPLTSSGKIQKYLLREQAVKKVEDLGIGT